MLGSRTIKTLTALLISMTIGAFALMMLETAPVRPSAQSLIAVASPDSQVSRLIRNTAAALQPLKWRNIIVHGSGAESSDIVDRCHFVIGSDGHVAATGLWERQVSGQHTFAPGRDFNVDSIGVCLVGDFVARGPSRGQLSALIELVRVLQPTFRIPGDRVYLCSDIDASSQSPGPAFPATYFNAQLLRASR